MASSQRRLIAALAVAALLAVGLPGAGFAGGSDEPGYTGGASSSSANNPGGSTTPPPAPEPIPDPLAPVAQAASAPGGESLGLMNVLTGYWLTISVALTLR